MRACQYIKTGLVNIGPVLKIVNSLTCALCLTFLLKKQFPPSTWFQTIKIIEQTPKHQPFLHKLTTKLQSSSTIHTRSLTNKSPTWLPTQQSPALQPLAPSTIVRLTRPVSATSKAYTSTKVETPVSSTWYSPTPILRHLSGRPTAASGRQWELNRQQREMHSIPCKR